LCYNTDAIMVLGGDAMAKWPWEVKPKKARKSRKASRRKSPFKGSTRTGGASKATLSTVMTKAGAYRRQGLTLRQALKKAWGTAGKKVTTRRRRATRRRRF